MRILVRVRGWQEMTARTWLVAGPTKIPDDAVFAIKYQLIRAKMPDNKNVGLDKINEEWRVENRKICYRSFS